MSEENKCKHEWAEPIDSPCEDDVYCVKCGCPGQRDDSCEGGVFWPAT